VPTAAGRVKILLPLLIRATQYFIKYLLLFS
jgi:hypothetical protein